MFSVLCKLLRLRAHDCSRLSAPSAAPSAAGYLSTAAGDVPVTVLGKPRGVAAATAAAAASAAVAAGLGLEEHFGLCGGCDSRKLPFADFVDRIYFANATSEVQAIVHPWRNYIGLAFFGLP